MAEAIYEDLENYFAEPMYLQERAIITPYNEIANKFNAYMMERKPGNPKTYLSHDTISQSTTGIDNQADL
ncbi:DNA helicase PIF1, ATP-dependent [Corchorus olitorius]|uniref:DNA helicase PIF1, ATP-dependent n=1 Tax=Corchorus olitorius TaxID=93759 RepID=A0A1R3KUM7_9ROSI|nr:DNA helicase PIF1, ATP-dependent [Corchorus olitorius]